MAEETITILKVGTEEAVKNIADLKENVKVLKQSLEDLEIGTEEYQDTLNELKVNQNALKDAMYATSTSMEDVSQAATGASESYNSLVHRMAALKEEFRATNDEVRRSELGAQINSINDKLKEMDALQGNFQRNVGNYTNSIKDAFKGMAEKTDAFGKSLNLANGNINGFKDSFEAFGKSPAIATFGILVSVALKLADELKENETAMASVKKAMEALSPVMDFLSGIVENLAEFLADLIGKVATFVTSNGLFSKIVKGVVGVGNSILQFIIAPFKGIAAAIKVFQEEGVKGIGNAAKAFNREAKSGISFKQNFETGAAVADTIIAGAQSKKKKVKDTGSALGKEMADGFALELEEIEDGLDDVLSDMDRKAEEAADFAKKREERRLADIDKATAHRLELNEIETEDERKKAEQEYAIREETNRRKLALLGQFAQDALERDDAQAYLDYQQRAADLEVEMELDAMREKKRIREQDTQDAVEQVQKRLELMQESAGVTSSILSSIADLYEANEESAEKNAKKIKAFRIASAIIDTLAGAVAALTSAQRDPGGVAGMIMGAANAASIVAAGMAQVAKIRNTDISGSSDSTASVTTATASVTAPTIPTDVAQVRNVTSASEEQRLNQMSSEQRVYILQSDIEASNNAVKTRVAEASF